MNNRVSEHVGLFCNDSEILAAMKNVAANKTSVVASRLQSIAFPPWEGALAYAVFSSIASAANCLIRFSDLNIGSAL